MDPRTSAQDVMRCDLCETAVVQMHCDTCLVNLCKACVGEHFSADLSKPHKIVDFKDRNSIPPYPGCTTHDKERCKMYGNQCDIPVCTKCLASVQHLGHKLSEILQILDEKREAIKQKQTELKEVFYPTYQNIASDIQNKMKQLKREYGYISTAITNHGEDWHRKINDIVMELQDEVNEMRMTKLEDLQIQLDEIKTIISDIKDEINSIEDVKAFKNISEFYSIKSDIQKYRNLPQKIKSYAPNFKPGKIKVGELSKKFGVLKSNYSISEEHGYSMKTTQKSSEVGSSPTVKQLLDEPETVTTLDTGYKDIFVGLYNVAYQNDKEIWTTGNENIMKLYSINQGSILKSMKTKTGSNPTDIAVTKSGDLVYTDSSHRTVNIVKNEKIEEVIRLQNWKPEGVCCTSSGDPLVIMDNDDRKQTKVVRYSGSKEKLTIWFVNKCKPLNYDFVRKYITENRNHDVFVSDSYDNVVVVFNGVGELRFRYTGHTPAPKNKAFCPLGITTDSKSHILTVDRDNDCVHIIDKDGHFLRFIDCGLCDPYGLCTDTDDNLFVAETQLNKVKKIKYML